MNKKIKITLSSLHDILREANIQIDDIKAFLDKDNSSIHEVNKHGDTPLLVALGTGNAHFGSTLRTDKWFPDPNLVEILLQSGANVNCKDTFGHTPLHRVLDRSSCPDTPNIVKLLLRYGADVSVRDKYGSSLLITALKWNHEETVIKILLEALDINTVNEVDPDLGIPPFLLALLARVSPLNIAQLFLQYGAKLSFRDERGSSILMEVLQKNCDCETFELLMEALDSTAVNEEDFFHNTPLSLAVECKRSASIVKLLLHKGADVSFRDTNGSSLLMMALKQKCDAEIVKLLLHALDATFVNEMDKYHNTPLTLAIIYKYSASIVKLLLHKGADVSFRDTNRCSLLMMALKQKCDETTINVLLEALGATALNEIDISHNTPLSLAVIYKCSASIVKLLLHKGADVSFRDTQGCSLLTMALKSQCDEATLKVLLEAVDDVTIVNEVHPRYKNLLIQAILFRSPVNIFKLLLEFGAVVTLGGQPFTLVAALVQCDKTILQILLDAIDVVTVVEIERVILFTLEETKCSADIVEMLLRCLGDVGFFNALQGQRILSTAVRYLREEETVLMLLKYFYLKINNFNVGSLLVGKEGYAEAVRFAADCALQLQKMSSVEVCRCQTLRDVLENESLPLDRIGIDNAEFVTQLLEMRVDVMCPIYLDMILAKVEKQIILSKLEEVMLHSVTNFNLVSGLQKVLLNYKCAFEIAEYLSNDELFRLILTFYIPHRLR